MATSAVVVASAIAVSDAATAVSEGMKTALISFAGGILGVVIAQCCAYVIASKNRKADAQEDSVRRAFDSAGSHVARVTFDRYVEFCEPYIRLWSDALAALLREGPTPKAIEHAHQIIRHRQHWILWVPPEVEATLKSYEDALLDVGRYSRLYEITQTGTGHDVDSFLDKMYRRFSELTGLGEFDGEKLDDNMRVQAMMEQLRATLGTDSYNKLRGITMRLALKDIEDFERQTGN